MDFHVLIPARLASTRLARKPLADIGGLPMIVRVARRAAQSRAASVVVAADDAEIVAACTAHGIRALLTGTEHASGSDRLAEVCARLDLADRSIVVNVQGDEPMIEPALVDACADLLDARADCVMSTVAHAIGSMTDFVNANIVKVVLDAEQRALYFSRAPIPFQRDVAAGGSSALPTPAPLRHVGIYAYRAAFLRRFPTLTASPLEQSERLEQLRVLWHGERIAVHVAEVAAGIGVDTQDDLDRVRALFAANGGAGFA